MDEQHDPGQVLHSDWVQQQGFTQTENVVLRDKDLSVQARFLYSLLKMYAWQKGSAYPGQETLAELMGVKVRMIQIYLKELIDKGLIERKQRGLTKSNLYIIKPLNAIYCASDTQSITGQKAQRITGQDAQSTTHEEDTGNKTQMKKREIAPAQPLRDISLTVPPGTMITRRPDAPKLRAVPKFAQTPEFAATLDTLIEIWPRRKDGAGPNRKLAERALVLVAPSEYPAVLAGARRVAASPDSREGVIKNLHAWLADEDWTRYTVGARPAGGAVYANGKRA